MTQEEDTNMLSWLMYTPLSKLPALPAKLINDDNIDLGNKILSLLEQNKIKIQGMDRDNKLIIGVS